MGDYQANSVGGEIGGTGTIEALWTDTVNGEDPVGGASAPSSKARPRPPSPAPPPPLPSPAPQLVTPTGTVTPTPTATLNPCLQYRFTPTTGATLVPGTDDSHNHCDDCTSALTLPFAYQLYDQSFTTARIYSNGNLQFVSSNGSLTNPCLPSVQY